MPHQITANPSSAQQHPLAPTLINSAIALTGVVTLVVMLVARFFATAVREVRGRGEG